MMLCCEVDDLKVAAAHSKTRLVPLINYVKVNLRHYSVISCSEAQDAQPFICVRTLPDRSAGRLWRALACVIASNNNLLCGVNQVSNYCLDKEPT